MRYGENPGYPAAFYQEAGASGPNMATPRASSRKGRKGLSYINVGDMDLGQRLAREARPTSFRAAKPASSSSTRCRAASPSATIRSGRSRRPGSATRSRTSAASMSSTIASPPRWPASSSRARATSRSSTPRISSPKPSRSWPTRKVLRVVKMGAPLDAPSVDNGLEVKRVAGGLLVQKRFDSKIVSPESVDVVSGAEADRRRGPGRDLQLDGGLFHPLQRRRHRDGGQDPRHRLRPAEPHRFRRGRHPALAARLRARRAASSLRTPSCRSPTSSSSPAKHGITAIIYPLGSVKDQEVIDKANELGLAMIITRKPGELDCERCFLHR